MDDQRAVLLDTENRHPRVESRLGHRVRHFTDQIECIQYIQNRLQVYQRFDLFLSPQNRNMIGNELVLFDRIYFHVYYPTLNDIPHNTNHLCMWIQRFEEADLWVKISYAIYRHDWTSYIQSNYSQAMCHVLRTTHDILLEEVRAAKRSTEEM